MVSLSLWNLPWPFSCFSRAAYLAFPAPPVHPKMISQRFICPLLISSTCVPDVAAATGAVKHLLSFLGLIMLDHDTDWCVYEEWMLSKGTLDKRIIHFWGDRLNTGVVSLEIHVCCFCDCICPTIWICLNTLEEELSPEVLIISAVSAGVILIWTGVTQSGSIWNCLWRWPCGCESPAAAYLNNCHFTCNRVIMCLGSCVGVT